MIVTMTTMKAAILDVVRGKAEWASLLAYGVDIRHFPRERRWEFGAYDAEPVVVTEPDVVEGINRQIADEGLIAEWAQFLLAASDLIDLDKLSDSEAGLLDCLWEISDGKLDCVQNLIVK